MSLLTTAIILSCCSLMLPEIQKDVEIAASMGGRGVHLLPTAKVWGGVQIGNQAASGRTRTYIVQKHVMVVTARTQGCAQKNQGRFLTPLHLSCLVCKMGINDTYEMGLENGKFSICRV